MQNIGIVRYGDIRFRDRVNCIDLLGISQQELNDSGTLRNCEMWHKDRGRALFRARYFQQGEDMLSVIDECTHVCGELHLR